MAIEALSLYVSLFTTSRGRRVWRADVTHGGLEGRARVTDIPISDSPYIGSDETLRTPRRLTGIIAFVALGLSTFSCAGSEQGGREDGRLQVEATEAWRDTVSVHVASVGSLEADAIVELKSETEGIVAEILAEEGERVRAGTVLVRLDDRELRARFDAAAAALRRARAEAANLETRLRRNEELLAAGAISPQTFDDLETSYQLAAARVEEAEANLALARRRLEQTRIRAPFEGTIGERNFHVGDLIRVGTLLYVIVDDDTLEVEFSIPERFAPRLQPGSPTTIRVASLPGESFIGNVSFVSPLVEAESRTVTAKAVIPNPAGSMRAGQFADVSVSLERRPDAVVVPETAVVPRSGQNFVFLVRADTARRRPVKLGERQYGLVEIASGVAVGDTVVVAGQQRLQDGAPVRLAFREAKAWREELLREAAGDGGNGERPSRAEGGGG